MAAVSTKSRRIRRALTAICRLLWILAPGTVNGQFGTGAILDPEEYLAQPAAATFAKRDAEKLPPAVSLREYCPAPGNQGKYSTCAAWACAFHARTILEAIELDRKGASRNSAEAFSPSFIYNQIRKSPGCDDGTHLGDALELMRTKGALKAGVLLFDCDFNNWNRYAKVAGPYAIESFLRLHDPFANNKVLPVKKALASRLPVVIGMHVPDSFQKVGADGLYKPTPADLRVELTPEFFKEGDFEGHAMAAVGYDDRKGSSGAVLLMNSWGTRWGDGGFCWVEYAHYNRFVAQSYSISGAPSFREDLAGSFLMETEKGARLEGRYDKGRLAYRLSQPPVPGTRFRIYLKVTKPVFLYAFGFDETGKTFALSPHEKGVSAFIPFQETHIPIPDDEHFIETDAVARRNDLCVLYSIQELPIARLLEKLDAGGKALVAAKTPLRTAVERELKALGHAAVPADRAGYAAESYSFSSKRAAEVCVPLVLEFQP